MTTAELLARLRAAVIPCRYCQWHGSDPACTVCDGVGIVVVDPDAVRRLIDGTKTRGRGGG